MADDVRGLVRNLRVERELLLDYIVSRERSPLEVQCAMERISEIDFILNHRFGRILYYFMRQIRRKNVHDIR